jgi:hypothetical protein
VQKKLKSILLVNGSLMPPIGKNYSVVIIFRPGMKRGSLLFLKAVMQLTSAARIHCRVIGDLIFTQGGNQLTMMMKMDLKDLNTLKFIL